MCLTGFYLAVFVTVVFLILMSGKMLCLKVLCKGFQNHKA